MTNEIDPPSDSTRPATPLQPRPQSFDAVTALLAAEPGPFVGNPGLWRHLGYRSVDAFRKAVERQTVPIETFTFPGRRGRFARLEDLVTWLRSTAAPQTSTREGQPKPKGQPK